jgi:hypothetical protein
MSYPSFRDWADKVDLPCVPGCDKNVDDSEPSQPCTGPWPWGSYETPLLAALRTIVTAYYRYRKDGGGYDPADKSTWPIGKRVRAHIAGLGFASKRIEALLATMARDPRLPNRW